MADAKDCPADGLHAALLEAGANLGRNGDDLYVLVTPEVEQILRGTGRPPGCWSFTDRITQKHWLGLPGAYDSSLPLRREAVAEASP